jgi:hypothetical protein
VIWSVEIRRQAIESSRQDNRYPNYLVCTSVAPIDANPGRSMNDTELHWLVEVSECRTIWRNRRLFVIRGEHVCHCSIHRASSWYHTVEQSRVHVVVVVDFVVVVVAAAVVVVVVVVAAADPS